ncbi:putative UPF0481 protein At3g02645 [Nicotiana tabacum]|uniref:UPF0481 protein At3g02645 n=2 Tax=Nicotiana TaxID=4085 RepID=A0A1S4B8F6_TOBAC|nr:PREDICTED: putative UPF0481 protein At3g02645 [Nicotiana sylvestris]XP_016485073.1 PREDICTED: putative UPF0481 protein At3g02645 [Nicotiana tabacum]
MTTESITGSTVNEQRWVNETIRAFTSELRVDIEPTPCVFQVPKTLTETKPQAYTPQIISLGPYHHFWPELLVTERHKQTIAKNCLNDHQVQHFAEEVIDKLCSVVPVIRGYYDKYSDIEGITLAWILAIDSLYLLHLLSSYVPGDQEVHAVQRKLAQDVMMLENQIPSFVLIETQKAINQSYSNLFTELFYNFCKAHSPLKLADPNIIHSFNSPHLLAFLHHLIIESGMLYWLEKQSGSLVPTLGNPGLVCFITGLPWDLIKVLSKNMDSKKKPLVDEIKTPSVTQLNETAKINFKLTGGIRNIKFVKEGGEHALYLPEITLNSDSEVILRNLVAYEAVVAGQDGALKVAEYLDLMCGIVNTSKDVEILKKSGIIKGSLSDEEIADLFNGLPKTTGNHKVKSRLARIIESVNEKYDNMLRIKAQRLIKKHIFKFRKSLTVITTLVLVLLLSMQTVCQYYGCGNH